MINHELFTIQEKKLFYQNKPIQNNNQNPFEDYEFINCLGSGANGITFSVRHKILDVTHVVKIFTNIESDEAKIKLEMQKNAKGENSDISSVTFSTGVINSPFQGNYSIMENINDSITLGAWVDSRNEFLIKSKKSQYYTEIRNFVFQRTLGVAASLLSIIIQKNERNIIHGDLNPKNILVSDIFGNWNKNSVGHDKSNGDSNFAFINSMRNRFSTVGTLEYIPTKLIDMGTSQATSTNKQVGKTREAYHILNDMRKLFSVFFVDAKKLSFKQLIGEQTHNEIGFSEILEINENYEILLGNQKINHLSVTDQFVRLILLMNNLLGNVTNQKDLNLEQNISLHDGKTDINYVNSFMTENFSNELDITTHDAKLLPSFLALANNKENSVIVPFIKWGIVWELLIILFPKHGLEKYGINKNTIINKNWK